MNPAIFYHCVGNDTRYSHNTLPIFNTPVEGDPVGILQGVQYWKNLNNWATAVMMCYKNLMKRTKKQKNNKFEKMTVKSVKGCSNNWPAHGSHIT